MIGLLAGLPLVSLAGCSSLELPVPQPHSHAPPISTHAQLLRYVDKRARERERASVCVCSCMCVRAERVLNFHMRLHSDAGDVSLAISKVSLMWFHLNYLRVSLRCAHRTTARQGDGDAGERWRDEAERKRVVVEAAPSLPPTPNCAHQLQWQAKQSQTQNSSSFRLHNICNYYN